MKRSRLNRSDPYEWQRRSAKRYEDKLRAEGHSRFRSIGTNRERRDREWDRAYESVDRVTWVQSLPCIFCGRTPSENAHVASGGTGRKSDARFVVPACGDRPGPHGMVRGCHWEMDHGIGKRAMERKYHVDLYAEAERVEKMWRDR